ncbi:MAG TPA: hypothetical protein VLH16_02360 [Bacteroidales bacterium]|nr:hypothetical protein [Bacteroidales bacterium]
MIVPIEQLQTHYFSGNIPGILITTVSPIVITIKLTRLGQKDVVLIEKYHPTNEQGVYLNIRELIHDELELVYSDTMFGLVDCVVQPKAYGEVTITPEGITPKSFYVIKGNLDIEQPDYNFIWFFRRNMLSISPQIRHVEGNEPVFLGFFSEDHFFVWVHAYKADGSGLSLSRYHTETTTNQLFSLKGDFDYVAQKLFPSDTGITQLSFQIWSRNASAPSLPLYLVKKDKYEEFSDFFLFGNSIGALETIHLTGQKKEELRHEHLRAKIHTIEEGTHEHEYQTIPLTVFEKNTGWIHSEAQRRYILDFFASNMRFHYNNNRFRRIYVLGYEGKTTQGQINSITFTFAYSRQYTGHIPSRPSLAAVYQAVHH